MPNPYPIVFVHGLLGWGSDELGGLPYFGLARLGIALGRLSALDLLPRARAFFPGVGPISSNHDRACELFYLLKGGDVHYGRAHAEEHGHRETIAGSAKSRQPLYPGWNGDHPIHVVGQAHGATTARVLQSLLARGDFFVDHEGKPYETDETWVRSITSISGIHNGTPTTYVFGASLEDGRIQTFSTAAYLMHTVLDLRHRNHAWPGWARHLYSFDLDQWDEAERFIYGRDNAVYDLSIHGAQQNEVSLRDFAATHYFSFRTSRTKLDATSGHYVPKDGLNPLFWEAARELGRFVGPLRNLRIPIEDYTPWWENDGLAPLETQDFPRWGKSRKTAPPAGETTYEPGVWHVLDTLDMDHLNIVALPRLSLTLTQPRLQVAFYRRLYGLLAGLPLRT